MADQLPRWLGAPYAPVGREGYLLKRNYAKGVGFSSVEEAGGSDCPSRSIPNRTITQSFVIVFRPSEARANTQSSRV